MINLIRFELTKLIKSKKNIIVLLLLVSSFLVTGIQTNNYNSNNLTDCITYYYTGLYNEGLRETDFKAGEVNPYILLDNCQKNNKLSDEFLNWDINHCENVLKQRDTTLQYRSYWTSDIMLRLAVDRHLQNNKMPYINFGPSMKGLFSLSTFSMFFPFLLVLLLSLIVGDIFNKEYNGGSYKVLLTQPYSRAKFAASKYIAVVIFTVSSLLIAFIINFIVCGMFFGFGTFDYPVPLQNNFMNLSLFSCTKYLTVCPLYLYFILTMAMDIGLILALCAAALFLTYIIKNRGLTLASLSVISIMFCVLYYVNYLFPPSAFNIFSYTNPTNILTARFLWAYNQNPLTFLDSVICSLVYTVLFFGLSLKTAKYKQYTT